MTTEATTNDGPSDLELDAEGAKAVAEAAEREAQRQNMIRAHEVALRERNHRGKIDEHSTVHPSARVSTDAVVERSTLDERTGADGVRLDRCTLEIGATISRYPMPEGSVLPKFELVTLERYSHVGGFAHVHYGVGIGPSAYVDTNAIVGMTLPAYAIVSINGDVRSQSHLVVINNIGSNHRTVTIYRAAANPTSSQTWEARISAGCFNGTADKLEDRIADPIRAWGQYARNDARAEVWQAQYGAVIALARAAEKSWVEDEELTLFPKAALWEKRWIDPTDDYYYLRTLPEGAYEGLT